MKPQTKINILICVETLVIVGGAMASLLYLAVVAALALPLVFAAIGASLFLATYITKRELKLTWREAWNYFWEGHDG
jgi:hypothetical protein